jgi:hypothetical protein
LLHDIAQSFQTPLGEQANQGSILTHSIDGVKIVIATPQRRIAIIYNSSQGISGNGQVTIKPFGEGGMQTGPSIAGGIGGLGVVAPVQIKNMGMVGSFT